MKVHEVIFCDSSCNFVIPSCNFVKGLLYAIECAIDIYGKNYNVGKYQKTYEKQIERAIEKAEQIIEFVKEKAPLIEMK